MNVCILAPQDNIVFAKNLLNNIKNVKSILVVSSDELENEDGILVNKRLEKADVFLAVIDKEFNSIFFLIYELILAKMIVGEKKKKTLIPVILDDAKPPRCIEEDGILYIKCNSNSYQDIQSLKNIIVNIIGQRKHTIKLDIENKKIIKLLFSMIMR